MLMILRQILVLMLTAGYLLGTLACAYAHQPRPDPDRSHISSPQKLRQIIRQKIDFYNKTWPEIYFIQLNGGDSWYMDMVRILNMLGDEPAALDYQHPAELREALMDVTLQRLKFMLQSNIVSSTLFRTGQNSTIKRANLCVIALDPQVFAPNDYQATRYMLDLPDEEMQKVHPKRYLNHIHHLEFTLHHEAFHCLDSHFNGGAAQTYKEMGGDYNMFLRESISDAYAMAMHLREHGDTTAYARNIVHFRSLWLSSHGHYRCTFETIRDVLNYDYKMLRSVSVKQLIELVTHIRNKGVADYDSYVTQRAAAVSAARAMGMDVQGHDNKWLHLAESTSNPVLTQYLINRYEYFYAKLFTDEPLLLEAPHKHDWKKK